MSPSGPGTPAGRPAGSAALPSGRLLAWFDQAGRALPWRSPAVTPWQVLVSEVMLAQTPVARVLPAWPEWVRRWPDPPSQAGATPAEVLRAWGSLGYPRRGLRLLQAARVCVHRHGGQLPGQLPALLELPGVGPYTARAVAAFGFGQPHPAVDVNVKRVLARACRGLDDPRPATAADRALLASLLPAPPLRAVRTTLALMELGALVCTARAPRCGGCPLASRCRWLSAGHPPWRGPRPARQRFAGTDRAARGYVMAALRRSTGALPDTDLQVGWPDPVQLGRAVATLLADGLAQRAGPGLLTLPTDPGPAGPG